jgi:hypothetical protein
VVIKNIIIVIFLGLTISCSSNRDNTEYNQHNSLKGYTFGNLLNTRYNSDLTLLLKSHEEQVNGAFCGIASLQIVLEYFKDIDSSQYRLLNPFFTLKTRVFGMTLGELDEHAQSLNLNTKRTHGHQLDIQKFKDILKKNLSNKEDLILINYSRMILNQEGSGHISPIGAFNDTEDMVLILDVSTKYEHTWIPLELLFSSINTIDNISAQYRGILTITNTD